MKLSCSYQQRLAVLSVAILALVVTVNSASALGYMAPYWSKSFGQFGNDAGRAIAVDGAGNIVVVGSFEGSVDFGGGDLNSAGGEDIFIAQYNQYGIHQWSMRFGSIGDDRGVAVDVDGAGSIYVTGYFIDQVELGGATLFSNGGRDIFVAKYNINGGHLWSFSYGSNYGNDEGHGVAVDGSGYVVFAGEFGNTMNYDGNNMTSSGEADIFIAKHDTFGNVDWSAHHGGVGFDSLEDVAVDKNVGDIYITGFFELTTDLGGGALVSAGETDIFLARYSPGGGHQWSARYRRHGL